MNRGDHREDIFRDNHDRKLFLDTLGQACAKTDWQVHAYCLMRNHFHLVVETPQPNLVDGMKWLLGTYTSRFNRRHRLFGHLFSGRYKALIVDGSGNGYLRTVCDYVHLNPVRAKLLTPEQSLRDFPWSSYRCYLAEPATRPDWLQVGRLFGEMAIPQDSPAGRSEFEWMMEQRRASETGVEWKSLRRGWYVGSQTFRQELLEQVIHKMGQNHYGIERKEGAEDKAGRIIEEELSKARLTMGQLATMAKSAPIKLLIATRIRQETTMTLKWISQRLQTGAWTHLNKRLYEQRRVTDASRNSAKDLPPGLLPGF